MYKYCKTNYSISHNTYPDEDIKNLTRERANAIIYRDFYKWNGLNKLPYKVRGFVVDLKEYNTLNKINKIFIFILKYFHIHQM